MYKIYIERREDPNRIYQRNTLKEARQLADRQQKFYVDAVKITKDNKVVFFKKINRDRTDWIIE